MDDKETIGLMIRRVVDYGTEYVRAEVMGRKNGEDCPKGIGGFWFAHEGKPFLDGLRMGGHISDFGDRTFCRSDIEYGDTFTVNAAKAEAMSKMLTKIHKQIAKDEAREDGDRFMSFAKAIGAQWVARPARGVVQSGAWANTRWVFYSVAEGCNYFRDLIRDAEREAQEKAGIKVAA